MKGSKYAIGGKQDEDKVFTRHTFNSSEIDSLYMFTDGYIDQFGGPDDRKFLIRRFKQMLQEIHGKPMKEQQKMLAQAFQNWKGDQRQIDDILILGLHIKHISLG